MDSARSDSRVGSLLMTEDDMATTLKTFQVERKQDLEHAKKMISERNKKEGEEFFAANAKRRGCDLA
jgi:hypothetical protein